VVALLVTGGSVEVAGAEVGAGAYPTSQAIAADAQFLEYAPRPDRPGVVCLVDSGVDTNPDTQGVVVGAEARDPIWGTGDGLTLPLVDGHPAGHGTRMAMLMAAPQNGWGLVGIAPSAVRVYSIRVVSPGVTGFPFGSYSYAIGRCVKLHITSEPQLTVVNLSLGGAPAPTSDELAFLTDEVEAARSFGLNVVSAAGNDGTQTTYPAAQPSVFAVGAADGAADEPGTTCTFSAGIPVDILAPGCNSLSGGVDEAFEDDGTPAVGYGTSQSAALVSAVIAAMRAYSPAIGVAEAELCLTASRTPRGAMDVAAAFKDCGLGGIVDAGLARIPSTPAAQSTAPQDAGDVTPEGSTKQTSTVASEPAEASPLTSVRLPTPRVLAIRTRRTLTVRVANRPKGAIFEARLVLTRRGARYLLAIRRSRSNSIIFRVTGAVAVEARFVVPGAKARTSQWTTKAIG
jgi:hypothetical protein